MGSNTTTYYALQRKQALDVIDPFTSGGGLVYHSHRISITTFDRLQLLILLLNT